MTEINNRIEWLYNPHAKPAKELSKHDQQMIQLGWDAHRTLSQPLGDKGLREKIYQALIDNTSKRRERYGDIEVTHIDTNIGNSVEAILALLQPKIEEAKREMCRDCTYKWEHNERVLASPSRCIITKKK